VKEVLRHEVIGPRQALAETVDFADSIIPRMPAVKTVAEWERIAGRMRSDALQYVIYRGAAGAWRDAKTGVEWLETIDGGPGYHIQKLRYEALPGFWVPALLYEPEKLSGKVAAVLNVNGHEASGKAADYEQARCINLAKRGILALHPEWIGMGQFQTPEYRHDLINHIDLCGSSGVATHYLLLKRGLDLLLALEHTDPERVAVAGLSGGGWQTIFISAFDTRVKLCNPVAGYSSLRTRLHNNPDLGDAEQTPVDLATVTDYAPMTALLAPRPALLTFNAKDQCCFAADHALPPLLEAARPIYKLYDQESNLRSHVNEEPGTHNYLVDNRQAFYRMLGEHFFKGQAGYDSQEIASDSEVKTRAALEVALPAGNATLHTLAMALSRSLPRDGSLPSESGAARSWRGSRRERLRDLVRARRDDAELTKTAEQEKEGVKATSWRVRVGGAWTVPVIELTRGEPKATTLIVADAGRQDSAGLVQERLARGDRVLAVDPYCIGESAIGIKGRDYLYSLLISAVGSRPLGVQATELTAVARLWVSRRTRPVSIVAVGPRASVMALVAAALEERAIDGLELRGSLGSLKELIEKRAKFDDSPELFCFGLLQDFDILQLAAMSAPRRVVFVEPSERAQAELSGLKTWYAAWGKEFDPLRPTAATGGSE
jgi:hypothetical protein